MTYTSQLTGHGHSAGEPLRPKWFISRGNGYGTPLVAVDELPQDVHILGISRAMRIDQFQGMECLGIHPGLNQWYLLDKRLDNVNKPSALVTGAAQEAEMSPYEASNPIEEVSAEHSGSKSVALFVHDPRVSGCDLCLPATSGSHVPHTSGPHTSLQSPYDHTQALKDDVIRMPPSPAMISHVVSPTHRPLPPSGKEPEQEKKEYCTHWLRTGECDYTQQGCLYKHEMPDRVTLERIGFRVIPRWWQERRALRSDSARHMELAPQRMEIDRKTESGVDYVSDSSMFSRTPGPTRAVISRARPKPNAGPQKVRQKTTVPGKGLLESIHATPRIPDSDADKPNITRRNSTSSDLLLDFSPLTPVCGLAQMSSQCEYPSSSTPSNSSSVRSTEMVSESSQMLKTDQPLVLENSFHARTDVKAFKKEVSIPCRDLITGAEVHRRRFVDAKQTSPEKITVPEQPEHTRNVMRAQEPMKSTSRPKQMLKEKRPQHNFLKNEQRHADGRKMIARTRAMTRKEGRRQLPPSSSGLGSGEGLGKPSHVDGKALTLALELQQDHRERESAEECDRTPA